MFTSLECGLVCGGCGITKNTPPLSADHVDHINTSPDAGTRQTATVARPAPGSHMPRSLQIMNLRAFSKDRAAGALVSTIRTVLDNRDVRKLADSAGLNSSAQHISELAMQLVQNYTKRPPTPQRTKTGSANKVSNRVHTSIAASVVALEQSLRGRVPSKLVWEKTSKASQEFQKHKRSISTIADYMRHSIDLHRNTEKELKAWTSLILDALFPLATADCIPLEHRQWIESAVEDVKTSGWNDESTDAALRLLVVARQPSNAPPNVAPYLQKITPSAISKSVGRENCMVTVSVLERHLREFFAARSTPSPPPPPSPLLLDEM